MAYECELLDVNQDYCISWVEKSDFITELSALSHSDVNQLLSLTVTLFATAWVFRFLSNFAYK